MDFKHIPVMQEKVLENLNLEPGNIVVDCTIGGAGHSLKIIEKILPNGLLIGIDRDKDAIEYSQKALCNFKNNIQLLHNDFSKIANILESMKLTKVNSILFDLGFSQNQLENSKRGFSFKKKEPLDMRMNIQDKVKAFDIINFFCENKLINIFFKLGEERFSKKIAKKIVAQRKLKTIDTSDELAKLVIETIPDKNINSQRIHPATRIFQALRIAVNKELEQLEKVLAIIPSLLFQKGRVGIISFHSLEDRIVKNALREFEKDCICPPKFPVCTCKNKASMKSVFKQPVLPDIKEIKINPMSRSAKLRVAQKV